MKYSLVVYKNNYNTLEIKGFAHISKYDDLNENSLEDIIKFTNEFTSEENLMETLLYCQLIPKDYRNGTFGIRYQKEKNTPARILQYGVSYQEDEHFFDIEYLKYYFSRNLNNQKFLEEFIFKYYDYLININIFSEPLNAIKYALEVCKCCKDLSNEELTHSMECMSKFVTYYTRRKDKNNNYKPSIYGLRDLAMFAINYERKNNRKEKPNKFKDENYMHYLEMQFKHYESLLSRRNNTDEEITAYTEELNRLQYELNLVSEKDYTLGRRLIVDEFTED